MLRMVERLSDRLVSIAVPRITASAAIAAPCHSPLCVGRCYCNECSGAWRAKCCDTGGGVISCRPCREGC